MQYRILQLTFGALFAITGLIAAAPGCGQPAAADGHPCPCGDGYACCDGRCVAGSCPLDAGVPLPTVDGSSCAEDPSVCDGKCGKRVGACGLVDCGGCAEGLTCGGGGPNVCGTGTCVRSCTGKVCGESDGCDGICAACDPPASGHGHGVCELGACALHCDTGYIACDQGCCPKPCDPGCKGCCDLGVCKPGNAADACGTGGGTCTACPVPPHGVAKCGSATCGVACDPGYTEAGGACSKFTGRVVLFGGVTDAGENGETWEWDGFTWVQRTVAGPSARSGHAMATLGNRVVLFGGEAGFVKDDTWEWDGTSWTQRTVTTRPSARAAHRMVTLGSHVLLFGGEDANGPVADTTWEWDGTAWTRRDVPGPSSRTNPAMATAGDRVLLVGGNDAGGHAIHDMWSWDGSAWQQITVSLPLANEYELTAFPGGALLAGGTQFQENTWVWNGTAWSLATDLTLGPRRSHALATIGGKPQVFGGWYDRQLLGDTWEWEPSSGKWSKRSNTGPAPRAYHAMAVLP